MTALDHATHTADIITITPTLALGGIRQSYRSSLRSRQLRMCIPRQTVAITEGAGQGVKGGIILAIRTEERKGSSQWHFEDASSDYLVTICS